MIKILTRRQVLARLARKERWSRIIYFYTGQFPPVPTLGLSLRVSSSSITPSTLFVCQQTHHR